MRKQTKIWKTKTGQIRICDMSDRHLLNTIRMLERRAEAYYNNAVISGYRMMGFLQGEVAQDCLEGELMQLEEEGPDEFLPDIYWNMLAECRRRNLNMGKELKKCIRLE